MDLSPYYRFEGSVFFVYDHKVLQKEVDLLEDAIVYFYPHTMPIDNQCILCGQLMGLVQFSDSMFGSSPILYCFKKEKIAVKHVGQYSFALAGSKIEPDWILIEQLDRLYNLFSFYHGSVDQVKIDCDNDKEMFKLEMRSLWEQYLAFIRNYGDNLPSVFNPVPYLFIKDVQNSCFLKASHILQACQRRPKVIAGCILYNRYILCSQLMDSISRCLLLLKPNQHHHPAVPLETDFQLPYGVRIFSVYLNENDLDQLLEVKENSPYKITHDGSTSPTCCCQTKRIVRRKGCVSRHMSCSGDVQDSGQHSMAASERDPLNSSSRHESENGATLCKAMLEGLIFKGLKCCKCVDDLEGELGEGPEEGSVCENSLDGIVWKKDSDIENGNVNNVAGGISENLPHQNEMVFERAGNVDERTESKLDERMTHSRQSGVTLEEESGIDVTGSDFHSSIATPFEQISVCSREGQQQVKWERSQKPIKIDSSQPGTEDIESCPTLEVFKEIPGIHGTHIERKRLDNSPDNLKGQQGVSNDDRGSHELPDECPAIAPCDSGGSHGITDVKLVDKEGSSKTFNDDYGSERTPSDNVDSQEIPDVGKEIHGITGDVWDSRGTAEDDIEDTRRENFTYSEKPEDFGTEKEDENEVDEEQRKEGDIEEKEAEEKGDEEEQEDEDTHNHVSGTKCCSVDGLVHANLFVQAHSEIVLILLTDCDLQQNEDIIKALWSTSLSELGELDVLLRHCSKGNKEPPQVPYNYLLYDNFEKTMSGNLKEPVFAVDHVFCDTTKTLHAHFENAPQLIDVTLRNLHTNIYGRRTLSKEVYFQENLANSTSSQRHQPEDASSYLEKKVQERLLADHGVHLV